MNKILLRRRFRPINLISLELGEDVEANIELIKKMKEVMIKASMIPVELCNPYNHVQYDTNIDEL